MPVDRGRLVVAAWSAPIAAAREYWRVLAKAMR